MLILKNGTNECLGSASSERPPMNFFTNNPLFTIILLTLFLWSIIIFVIEGLEKIFSN